MTARPRLRTLAIAALLSAASDGPASAAGPNSTQLLSRPSGVGTLPAPGDGSSFVGRRSVSSDGRRIVFASSADDLGVGDTMSHIWVRDTVADTTQLVDREPGGGAPGNNFAGNASISRDGSTVCFESSATNLVPGVTGNHVFVVKLATGAVQVADRSSGAPGAVGDGDAERCALDTTGTRVVFDSRATNLDLVTDDTNAVTDVFVRNLGAGTTTRVSLGPGNAQTADGGSEGAISGDGLKVAFTTRAALLPGDTNNSDDVYVLNMQTSVLVRVSVGTGSVEADQDSSNAALDDTGGHVAFASKATNLDLGGDSNQATDVFWRDLTGSDTTILVSRATGGGAIGDDDSTNPDISGDGLGVAFESQATNLGTTLPPGPFGSRVYLRRLGTNETSMLSRATGAAGAPADSLAGLVSLGGTPTVAVWASLASNLDPAASGDFFQVFKRELSGSFTTSLVSRPPGGGPRSSGVNSSSLPPAGAISADGRLVVFVSSADGLDPAGAGPFAQAFLRDVAAGTTTLLSRGPGPSGAVGDSFTFIVGIAAGGTHVAFVSFATNLLPGVGPAEVGNGQLYVRELATGNLELASRADGVDGAPVTELSGSGVIGISADGRRVVFTTGDDLVSADTNGDTDVYVRDLVAGTTTLVSVAAGGGAGDGDSSTPSLSADGTRVAFDSRATNLLAGEPTTETHVYVRDLVAGTTVLVDRTEAGTPGDGSAFNPLINGAGTRVAFRSDEALTPVPVSPSGALYVRDLVNQTTLIAARADGPAGALAPGPSEYSINHDGTRVSWTGSGAELPGGPDTPHVYLRDLVANTTRLVSAADGTVDVLANDQVFTSAIDAGGGCVAFVSNANNLTTPAYASRDFQHVYLRAVDGNCPVGATTSTTTSTTSTTLPSSSRTPIAANAVVLKPGKFAKLVAKGLVLDLVDPTTAGGTLAVVGTTGSASYALPASGWKAVGKRQPKGFKFKGAGCRGSLLRKKIKVACHGNTGSLSLPEPGPVAVELTVNGAGSYCTQCGGTAAGKATRVFKRKRCPAPAACP